MDEQLQYSVDGGIPQSSAISDEHLRKPIQAYIENAHDDSIGGFTIPLPTTKEMLQPWLDAIGAGEFNEAYIAIWEARSPIPELGNILSSFSADELAFDELNYLAAKVSGMKGWQLEMFSAALEVGQHNGSVKSLINLAENIDHFELQPAFSEEQYGSFHIQMEKDNSMSIFDKLEQSSDPDERLFAQYVLRLEEHVDEAAYGRGVVREENGHFTSHGYLADRGEFSEVYRGAEDIPSEHRIFTATSPPIMVINVDVPSLLAQLHAVTGDFSRDTEHSINILSSLRSADYLLLMSGDGAFLTEAMHAYRHGTTAFDLWANAETQPETQAFSIHLTEVHGRIEGNIAQVDVSMRQRDILENSIHPVNVAATLQNGETKEYTLEEWDALEPIEKDQFQNWRRVFEDEDYSKVIRHVDELSGIEEDTCRIVSTQEFLVAANAAYMEHAQQPQADMLRVSQTAAKEMLARGDGTVYRLLPDGPEKLSPTDAFKGGLWFSEHREFAIRREDMAGFQKWAERSAADILNHSQARNVQDKKHEPEI